MRTRLHRAQRLRHIHERMHRRAEQDLAVLDRQVQAADAAQADLIRTLNEASWFHAPIRATAVERLKSLAVAAQDLRAARASAAQRLLERATRHKQSDLWVGRLETDKRHRLERQDWADQLDLLTGPDASLRSAKPVIGSDGSHPPPAPGTAPGFDGGASCKVNPDPRAP